MRVVLLGAGASISVDGIFFDDAYFLNHLRVRIAGEHSAVTFFDPDFDRLCHDEPVIVGPTFLKSVPAGAEMLRIWHLAGQALRRADVVEVWGYSLPVSDSAVRVLLNVLRFRVQEHEVHLNAYDPNNEARERWDQFIGIAVSKDAKLG